jgi:hypothetical protein
MSRGLMIVMLMWVTENFPFLQMMVAQLDTKFVILLLPGSWPHESLAGGGHCIEFVSVNGIIVLPIH